MSNTNETKEKKEEGNEHIMNWWRQRLNVDWNVGWRRDYQLFSQICTYRQRLIPNDKVFEQFQAWEFPFVTAYNQWQKFRTDVINFLDPVYPEELYLNILYTATQSDSVSMRPVFQIVCDYLGYITKKEFIKWITTKLETKFDSEFFIAYCSFTCLINIKKDTLELCFSDLDDESADQIWDWLIDENVSPSLFKWYCEKGSMKIKKLSLSFDGTSDLLRSLPSIVGSSVTFLHPHPK